MKPEQPLENNSKAAKEGVIETKSVELSEEEFEEIYGSEGELVSDNMKMDEIYKILKEKNKELIMVKGHFIMVDKKLYQ